MRLPPKWLLKLKPGEYDLSQLVKITKKTRTTVRSVMVHHGAEVKKIDSGYRNLLKIVLIWKGWATPAYEIHEGNSQVNTASISTIESAEEFDKAEI